MCSSTTSRARSSSIGIRPSARAKTSVSAIVAILSLGAPTSLPGMCVFCDIVAGAVGAEVVLDDELTLAFLDHRPIFPGHTLLVPKQHFETLADLPLELVDPLFRNARLLSGLMESALEAQGSFVAVNNKVSQSVPHLHVHVVPRRRKDGLRGFFWPRHKYGSPEEMAAVGTRLKAAVEAAAQ